MDLPYNLPPRALVARVRQEILKVTEFHPNESLIYTHARTILYNGVELNKIPARVMCLVSAPGTTKRRAPPYQEQDLVYPGATRYFRPGDGRAHCLENFPFTWCCF